MPGVAVCPESARQLVQSIDEIRLVELAGRFDVNEMVRPPVDRDVFALELEANRAGAEDHDPFAVANRTDDEPDVRRLWRTAAFDRACPDAAGSVVSAAMAR